MFTAVQAAFKGNVMKKSEEPKIIVRLNPQLVKTMKLYCVGNDISMQAFIEGLIVEALKKEGKL